MTLRLAVSWRSSRSASENSVSPVSVKFLIGPLLSVDQLVELAGGRIDVGQRRARFVQGLAEFARILAGQRLAGLGILRPDLQGDQVQRVGQIVELVEGLAELGDGDSAARPASIWIGRIRLGEARWSRSAGCAACR